MEQEAIQKLDAITVPIVSPIFKPKIESVINRLVGLQPGETVSFNPLGEYTTEEYIHLLRKMLGERDEVEGRNYSFKGFKDYVVVGWTPHQGYKFDKAATVKNDWGSYIRRAAQLKDGESCEFTVPADKDLAKFKTNLATTLGYNAKDTKDYRWGVLSTKGSRVLIVTRYGLRSEVPPSPQNIPKPVENLPVVAPPKPPIQLPSSVPSSYDSVIAMLDQKRITLMSEIAKIETAIGVLKSLI